MPVKLWILLSTGILLLSGYRYRLHPPMQSPENVIKVNVSDTFSISLKASIGTGFSWQLKDSTYSKKACYLRQENKPAGQSIPGSPDLQVFYFKALATGTTHIRFIYVRPFEKPQPAHPPLNTTTVIIR